MVQLLCTNGLWVHIPYKKHKISDCEPGCGKRTFWTRRLVKEADMGEVRSGISWQRGGQTECWWWWWGPGETELKGLGVGREEEWVDGWWQKWWEQKQWAKESAGQLTSDEKRRAGFWFPQRKRNEAWMGKQRREEREGRGNRWQKEEL